MSDTPKKTIVLSEAEILLKQPAKIEVLFSRDQMDQIVVTFDQTPGFTELVAAYKAVYGNPASEKLVDNAFEQSEVRWVMQGDQAVLTVTAAETQRMVRVFYSLQRK